MCAPARLFVLAAAALLVPATSHAQVTWQPAAPPLVTAEHESWFQSGEPIIWSGDYYYQSGPRQFFNGYQMVRSGSFRGIPLYTDATREPYSIVFVPVGGGLMQPYERRRTGALAGTTGATAPSFPTDIGAEGVGRDRTGLAVDIAPYPGAPARARAYDLGEAAPAPPPEPAATAGTRGPVMTSIAPLRDMARGKRGRRQAGIWLEYEGHRWVAHGVAIEPRPADFRQRGTYHGFPVYERDGDANTIYIPAATGGLLTPFRRAPGA